MASSEDYDIVAANNHCANQQNKSTVISTPGTPTHTNQVQANAVENQHVENSKYDNTDAINVTPLYGGNKKKKNNKYYKIYYDDTVKIYKATSYKKAIEIFLSKNNIKKDYLLEICDCNKNKELLYLLKVKK